MGIDKNNRPWWTLAGTCAGLFLLMLDSTVVALALPSIRHDVGATAEGLQWVMNGYLLAIAVFVVTAGRLGDMFGRKRLFLAGMVVFALGSVISGAAGSQETLIVGRILQGIGAAPMLPLSLAIVCNAFPASEQARALGVWAGVSALALSIGPLASTKMACEQAVSVQEDTYLATLGKVASYAIEGGTLTLSDESGAMLLSFSGKALR